MPPWFAGAARLPLPEPSPHAELLGWGRPDGRCTTVHTPLLVRALVLHQGPGSRPVVFVQQDLCMACHAVRARVLAELQRSIPEANIDEDALVMAVTHTHAGPGGYLHDLFYTLNNAGHDAPLRDGIVTATAAAITAAWHNAAPATLSLGRAEYAESEPVAFNRSLDAYAQNKTTAPPVVRQKDVLRVVSSEDGTPIAAVDWHGNHGTTIHSDQCVVHPDHKGIASAALEAHAQATWGSPHFVALFLQGAAGDITPNSVYSRSRGLVIGHLGDDFAQADYVGQLSAHTAAQAWQGPQLPLDGPLDSRLHWLDFDGFVVDADLADGRPRRTASGVAGLPFIEGTAEGPGPLRPVRGLFRALTRRHPRRLTGQGPKLPFAEVGRGREGRAFGFFRMSPPAIPALDPVVAATTRFTHQGGIGPAPWIANRAACQLVRLGPLCIVCVAGEPTTHAGRLMEHTAARAMAEHGVEHVVLCGYANSFSGYTTTAPEYRVQAYEGGHTLFGPWTLAAWRTGIRQVARTLAVPPQERPHRGPRPPVDDDATLHNRATDWSRD